MTADGGTVRLATSPDGQVWDNPDLLRELGESVNDTGQWSVWNWSDPGPAPAPLQIVIAVPDDNRSAAADEFVEAVDRQLRRAFGLFSGERGWPKPGYQVSREASLDGDWSYSIQLPGGPGVGGHLLPSKLLAMGDDSQLSPLLGLETVDPVLGLPAKWIARSQIQRAQIAQLHLFDGPGLVAAHTLHMLGEIWYRCFGFLEMQSWLLESLPGHAPLLATVVPQHLGLLLKTIKDLIADGLWLPQPSVFLELFTAAISELQEEEQAEAELLKEMLRRDIVPLNLQRFADHEGILHAVEWRGDPEGDDSTQSRLLTRLAEALAPAHESSGCAIVITDREIRPSLGRALQGPFPYLPVLSWAELPSHARVAMVAVVDARFEVDPSPWTFAAFEVAMPST